MERRQKFERLYSPVEFRMKKLLKSLLVTAGVSIAAVASAQAASVSVSIDNNSAKSIGLDAVSCTGCTSSSASSIPANGSGTSSATANSTATSMTYRFDYAAYYNQGTSIVKKGCRGSITLSVSGGVVTGIVTSSWTSFTGPATCTKSSPQLSGGTVFWDVRLTAS